MCPGRVAGVGRLEDSRPVADASQSAAARLGRFENGGDKEGVEFAVEARRAQA